MSRYRYRDLALTSFHRQHKAYAFADPDGVLVALDYGAILFDTTPEAVTALGEACEGAMVDDKGRVRIMAGYERNDEPAARVASS